MENNSINIGIEETTVTEKKSKLKAIVIALLVALISVVAVTVGLIAFEASKTFDSVALVKSEIELGSDNSLVSLVSYDKEKVSKVEVAESGGFGINKAGTYSVTYSVTSVKGKTKDFVFEVTVKDTVAPKLELSQRVVYLMTKAEFDINDYATATDKSKTQTVCFDEMLDTNKEGMYLLGVYAKDGSGNKSEKQEFTVYVENRENCDVRFANFGDTKDVVERYEPAKDGKFVKGDELSILKYKITEQGHTTDLTYYFNSKGELFLVTFEIETKHKDPDGYIGDYYKIDDALEEKFGKPSVSDVYTGSLYSGCSSDAQALILGQIAYGSVWRLDDMNVAHTLVKDGEITHFYSYQSKNHDAPSGY